MDQLHLGNSRVTPCNYNNVISMYQRLVNSMLFPIINMIIHPLSSPKRIGIVEFQDIAATTRKAVRSAVDLFMSITSVSRQYLVDRRLSFLTFAPLFGICCWHYSYTIIPLVMGNIIGKFIKFAMRFQVRQGILANRLHKKGFRPL